MDPGCDDGAKAAASAARIVPTGVALPLSDRDPDLLLPADDEEDATTRFPLLPQLRASACAIRGNLATACGVTAPAAAAEQGVAVDATAAAAAAARSDGIAPAPLLLLLTAAALPEPYPPAGPLGSDVQLTPDAVDSEPRELTLGMPVPLPVPTPESADEDEADAPNCGGRPALSLEEAEEAAAARLPDEAVREKARPLPLLCSAAMPVTSIPPLPLVLTSELSADSEGNCP